MNQRPVSTEAPRSYAALALPVGGAGHPLSPSVRTSHERLACGPSPARARFCPAGLRVGRAFSIHASRLGEGRNSATPSA